MERPVSLQYLQKCTVNGSSNHLLSADLVILTDNKALPLLINFATTFDQNPRNGLHPSCPLHIIPSSFKQGCGAAARATQHNPCKLRILKWCQENLRRTTVLAPDVTYCQSSCVQSLAASLVDCGVVVSTEPCTAGFNGLGILTLQLSVPDCESLLFGHPLEIPPIAVCGVQVVGELPPFAVSTDLVLQFIRFLKSICGGIAEVWGVGLSQIALSDRIAVANMVKETSLDCIYFPCDSVCLDYLRAVGPLLHPERKAILCRPPVDHTQERAFSRNFVFDLSTVQPTVSGPKRSTDRILLADFPTEFRDSLFRKFSPKSFGVKTDNENHGKVLSLSLAGCTNFSNALVTLHTALLARNILRAGLSLPADLSASYAPGTGLAGLYLEEAGLEGAFRELGLAEVRSCCAETTRPVVPAAEGAVTCALISGNGNYEARRHPGTSATYLLSSPLALRLALAGRVDTDLTIREKEEGEEGEGEGCIWPGRSELIELESRVVLPQVCARVYGAFREPCAAYKGAGEMIPGAPFPWDPLSTYVARPPYLEMRTAWARDIVRARVLLSLGDNVTSDQISPSGSMSRNSPAATFLSACGVSPRHYDSYGNRRGNYHIVAAGIFSKARNTSLTVSGAFACYRPSGRVMDVVEAAASYSEEGIPMVILAGANYCTGVSRDSGARGVRLLGVTAIVAHSFHPPHIRELAYQGVLPVQCSEVDCVDPTSEISIAWSADNPRSGTLTWEGGPPGSGCRSRVPVTLLGELALLRTGGLVNWALSRPR